ncbi:unnamed protein product [Calypogeia fissa]
MSDSLSTMEKGAEPVSDIELSNLSEDAMVSIILKLDLQSVLMLTRATRKLKQAVENDLVWMERCKPWEDLVNLNSWRAQMDSWKALYRLLHSLTKLVGAWVHRGSNLCGELIYVTWGINALDGWRVVPGAEDAYQDIRFVEAFNVVGKPDGSHKVDLVDKESLSNSHLSTYIVLPSLESPNRFVLERHDLPGEQIMAQDGSKIQLATGGPGEAVKETQVWRKRYQRLEFEEPSPEQELTGLWTGLYGPHGWEILNVSYTEDDVIVGTKVIGDPNVPSGEISFTGNMGRMAIDFPHLVRPANRDRPQPVAKACRGHGRIADDNFVNPQWVDGLLVVEPSGYFYFIWAEMNFNIRFHRLDLDASFQVARRNRGL